MDPVWEPGRGPGDSEKEPARPLAASSDDQQIRIAAEHKRRPLEVQAGNRMRSEAHGEAVTEGGMDAVGSRRQGTVGLTSCTGETRAERLGSSCEDTRDTQDLMANRPVSRRGLGGRRLEYQPVAG